MKEAMNSQKRSWVGPPDSLDEALTMEVVRHVLIVVRERRPLEFQLALAELLKAGSALLDHRR